MIPTSSQVFSAVRGIFSDNGVDIGDRWGNNALRGFLQAAYSALFAQAKRSDITLAHQFGFYNLFPYTRTLSPAVAAITNLDVPVSIKYRPFTTTYSILSIVNAGTFGIAVTCSTPHLLGTGQETIHTGCLGVPDQFNGRHIVTVSAPTTYFVLGIQIPTSGIYTPSSGIGTIGTGDFCELRAPMERNHARENLTPVASELANWYWDGSAIIFDPPCSAGRQIQIEYQASANLPSGSEFPLIVDDSLNFLAYYTAALAILNINPGLYQMFMAEACGPTRKIEDLGGYVGSLLRVKIRQENTEPTVRPGFRPRRPSRAARSRGGGGCAWV